MRGDRRGIVLPYCHNGPGATPACTILSAKRATIARCYHHIEMRPETVGRVLGIGLRVAGRVAGQRIGNASAPSPASNNSASQAQNLTRDAVAEGRRVGGGLLKGVGGFLRPFTRVGGILWLEVTGVFFLLPVVVFTPTLWRTRASWASGPDHRTFVSSAIVVVVFFYLGVSSFWRARRRSAAQAASASK